MKIMQKDDGVHCVCPCNEDSVVGPCYIATGVDKYFLYRPSDMLMMLSGIDNRTTVLTIRLTFAIMSKLPGTSPIDMDTF